MLHAISSHPPHTLRHGIVYYPTGLFPLLRHDRGLAATVRIKWHSTRGRLCQQYATANGRRSTAKPSPGTYVAVRAPGGDCRLTNDARDADAAVTTNADAIVGVTTRNRHAAYASGTEQHTSAAVVVANVACVPAASCRAVPAAASYDPVACPAGSTTALDGYTVWVAHATR